MLLLSSVGFVIVSILVASHRSVLLDQSAVALFRPNGEWGELQTRVDVIVEGLRPLNTIALTLALAITLAVRRRSWRPFLCTGITLTVGLGVALATKFVFRRPDLTGDIGGIGGSYPSGHVIAALLSTGCALLMWSRIRRWLAWAAVGLAGLVVAWALMVQTAHWFTDVLAAFLLGVAVLAVAAKLPWHACSDRTPPA